MNKVIEVQKEIDSIKSQVVGFTYRHFKGGIYIVTDVAVNTETLELEVIYKPVNAPWPCLVQTFKYVFIRGG